MKAIQTKYLGATNTKPARIKASTEGVPSKTYSKESLWKPYGGSGEVPNYHIEAAQRFARENNWSTDLASGGLPCPDVWVHCFLPKSLLHHRVTDKLAVSLEQTLAVTKLYTGKDIDPTSIRAGQIRDAEAALAGYHAQPATKLRQAVTGKIERGEAEPVVEIPALPETDNQKHQAYLDFVNNYLTTEVFAERYQITTDKAKALIAAGRNIHEARAAKSFTVIAVSSNTNSFGLKSIILVAEDGEAWEILKSAYSDPLPKRGDTIKRAGGVFAIGCECPRRLKDSSPAVAKKIIAEAKRK